jgi:hypothetical protein
MNMPSPGYFFLTSVCNGARNRVIAERFHVTEGRVSQIKKSAVQMLRKRLGIRLPAESERPLSYLFRTAMRARPAWLVVMALHSSVGQDPDSGSPASLAESLTS